MTFPSKRPPVIIPRAHRYGTRGLTCPVCFRANYAKTVDSRPLPQQRRRRYECLNCGARFTTSERIVIGRNETEGFINLPVLESDVGDVLRFLQTLKAEKANPDASK